MNAFTWLIISDVTCAVATVYLVMNGHPGWAAAFFIAGLLTSVKSPTPKP